MTLTDRDDAAALLAWMDDAHHAVDLGHALSPAMCLALMATPDQPAARALDAATMPRTWFLEEYERVMRTQLRDPVPFGGPDGLIDTWRQKQARHSDDLANLLHQHTRCVELARAFAGHTPAVSFAAPLAGVRPDAKGKGKPRRRSAASVALDAVQEAA